jgi:hypothetical protein
MKALVLNKDVGNKTEGEIILLGSQSDIDSFNVWIKVHCEVVDYSDEYGAFIHMLKAEKDENGDYFISMIGSRKKGKDISDAYSQMVSDIETEMATTFGTTRSDSAQASYATWKEMKTDPHEYTELGLKAEMDIYEDDDVTKALDKDEAIDHYEKVQKYSAYRIRKSKEYAKYRLQRIQQFREEKETIENS